MTNDIPARTLAVIDYSAAHFWEYHNSLKDFPTQEALKRAIKDSVEQLAERDVAAQKRDALVTATLQRCRDFMVAFAGREAVSNDLLIADVERALKAMADDPLYASHAIAQQATGENHARRSEARPPEGRP